MPTTSGLPTRSASIPTSGENANIPRMCPLMTRPMTSRLAPPWSMWIGVITMTDTMTAWLRAIPTAAARTSGVWRMTAHGRSSVPGSASPVSSCAPTERASSSGSGRSRAPITAAAASSASDGEHEGAGLLRDVQPSRDHGAGSAEVGSENRTDRRRPHHGAEVAPAAGREREVRGRVPALQVRGGRPPRGAPSRRAATGRTGSHPTTRHSPPPSGAGEVADGQARAATVAGHERRQDRRDDRRAEGLGRLRQPGEAVRARDVLGQQRADGDRRAEADAADGLGGDERSDGMPLGGGDVGGRGHRPRV